MISRNPPESREHRRLIEAIVSAIRGLGHIGIQADHPLHPEKPDKVNGHEPDVLSYKNNVRHIFEAETCGSISDSHTEEQWKAFDRADGRFVIVVPKRCAIDAERRRDELGINADVAHF